MFEKRGVKAITVSAVGLTVLLATPRSALSQDLREANPATPALDAPVGSISGFSHEGIRIRLNGGWAWRPIRRSDWQAYFRCRMGYGFGGYGLAGYGWTPFPPTWLPYPPSTWDFGVVGSIRYPPGRFYGAWDPWHMGPGGYLGFGSYGSCLDPFGWSPFLMLNRGVGFVRVRYPSPYSVMYGLGDRIPLGISDGWPPGAMNSGARARWPADHAPRAPTGMERTGPEGAPARAFIDPVRRESLDRNRWIGPREASGEAPVSRKTPGRIVEPVRSPSARRGTLRPETAGSRPNQKVRAAKPQRPASPRQGTPRAVPRMAPRPEKGNAPPKIGGKTKSRS